MSEDKDAKTEEPTAKRMGKAWNEGNIPVSQEVKSAAMLLAALVVVGVIAPWVANELTMFMRSFIERPETMQIDADSLRTLFTSTIWRVGVLLAFPVLVMAIAAVVGTLGQIGLVYTPKKLAFNLGNMSPISGFKRMFSMTSLIEAGKGIFKMIVVGAMIGFLVVPTMSHPDKLIDQDVRVTLKEIHHLIVLVLLLTVLVMSALAAADYMYQRWSHKEKLKMSKQEIKDEHKEQDGDPKVKSRIRNLRLERHRSRMMANVARASVIITNPTHYAVALEYDMDTMAAPVVTAKGVDFLAKRMRQVAETHEIPIVENPPLARALYAAVDIDHPIPTEHYKAVAEVIGFVMKLKGKRAS